MTGVAYIVPSELLTTNPPASEYHATGIPPDFSQWLVIVKWDNPNAEVEFESLAGVLPLGAPWEPLPDAATPLLASLEDSSAAVRDATTSLPSTDALDTAPPVAVSVFTALRKTGWLPARIVR